MPQVGARARPIGRHQRLDAKLLEHLEYEAPREIGRRQAAVQGEVGVRQAQRQRVGRAAERCVVVFFQRGIQMRRGEGQQVLALVQAARWGRVRKELRCDVSN